MRIPIIIMGGGVLGLLTALAIKKQHPGLDLALFDQNPFWGEGATSRNSGVLHAGIYYPHQSLKHSLCMAGNELWRSLASEFEIPILECGKYIIASTKDDIKGWEKTFSQGIKNGVTGLREVSVDEVQKLKQYAHIEKAFFSPNTAVLDTSVAIQNIARYLHNKDIPLMLNNKVLDIQKINDGFQVKTEHETLECDFLINLAGAHAPDLRSQLLPTSNIESYWVKGHYLKLARPFYNESLIYPVPNKDLKGLGVHTSFGFDRQVRFGPNVEDTTDYDYQMNTRVIDQMFPAIEKIFKGIEKKDLQLDYCGIRSKIKINGELYPDFWIKNGKEWGMPGYFEALGIESPGLTASPAIANLLASWVE